MKRLNKKKVVAYEKYVSYDKYIVVRSTNPRYFATEGVRNMFDAVYAPSYPEIEEAYKKAGKEVIKGEVFKAPVEKAPESAPVIEEKVMEEKVVEKVDNKPTFVAQDETAFEVEEVLAKPVEEMTWNELRAKAKELTDEPIKSKEQAIEIILANS